MYNDETKEEFLKHMSEVYDNFSEKMHGIEFYNIGVELIIYPIDESFDTFIATSNFNVDGYDSRVRVYRETV